MKPLPLPPKNKNKKNSCMDVQYKTYEYIYTCEYVNQNPTSNAANDWRNRRIAETYKSFGKFFDSIYI